MRRTKRRQTTTTTTTTTRQTTTTDNGRRRARVSWIQGLRGGLAEYPGGDCGGKEQDVVVVEEKGFVRKNVDVVQKGKR